MEHFHSALWDLCISLAVVVCVSKAYILRYVEETVNQVDDDVVTIG